MRLRIQPTSSGTFGMNRKRATVTDTVSDSRVGQLSRARIGVHQLMSHGQGS